MGSSSNLQGYRCSSRKSRFVSTRWSGGCLFQTFVACSFVGQPQHNGAAKEAERRNSRPSKRYVPVHASPEKETRAGRCITHTYSAIAQFESLAGYECGPYTFYFHIVFFLSQNSIFTIFSYNTYTDNTLHRERDRELVNNISNEAAIFKSTQPYLFNVVPALNNKSLSSNLVNS